MISASKARLIHSRLPELLQQHLHRKYLEPGRLTGYQVLVARHGEIALFDTAGLADRENKTAMAEDTIFRIYSMTKPVTSVALMQQYERGRFLLEDPVHKYLPEFKDLRVFQGGSWPDYLTIPPKRPPTIRDLLTHTSGLTYDFLRRTNVDYGYRKAAIAHMRTPCSLEEFPQRLVKLPLEFSPGEQWNYSVATDVCGRLVEVLSGQPFDEYLSEHIFTPLGMKDTGFQVPVGQESRLAACYEYEPGAAIPHLVDPGGAKSAFASQPAFLSGGGGLVSTTADYYRFCACLLNGGELDGAYILGPRTLSLMTSNHLPDGADMEDLGAPGTFSEAPYRGIGFGLGFAVLLDVAKAQCAGHPGEYFWGGLASTSFWISPADDLIVIFMTQLMPSASWPVRRELRGIIHGCLLD